LQEQAQRHDASFADQIKIYGLAKRMIQAYVDGSTQQAIALHAAYNRLDRQRSASGRFNFASTFFGILRDDIISNDGGRLRGGGMQSGEETKGESKEEKKPGACYGALPKDLLKQRPKLL
jgi:hypothetical protein